MGKKAGLIILTLLGAFLLGGLVYTSALYLTKSLLIAKLSAIVTGYVFAGFTIRIWRKSR